MVIEELHPKYQVINKGPRLVDVFTIGGATLVFEVELLTIERRDDL